MRTLLLVLTLTLIAGCREEPMEPLSAVESADLQARAYNFQVYPDSIFLEAQTELLRRAHFILEPDAVEAPPMAMYDSADPLETVAQYYAQRYGYEKVAPNDVNDFSSVKPPAYYTSGDLGGDAAAVEPIAEKLGVDIEPSTVSGTWRGAHISPTGNLPRVTLQRPYYDLANRRVVDKTLIVLVRE